jgi:hypothetical protein
MYYEWRVPTVQDGVAWRLDYVSSSSQYLRLTLA